MNKLMVITGPTGSGKTKLSLEIAERINNSVIISADSRQIYKYIQLATCSPKEADLKKIKHYFVNELNPEEEFNAGEFGKHGRDLIQKLFDDGKFPVVCGGSGLYIKSLIDGFFEGESSDSGIRKNLYEKLKDKGNEFLYNELKEIDKIAASKLIPQNIRRIIRALEIYYVTGKKFSDLQNEKSDVNFIPVQYGLLADRKFLYENINRRVDEMIKEGLIEEIKELKEKGFDKMNLNSLDTVGVKEVFKYLNGEYNLIEMSEMIKQNTRRYAKRQMTWFRRDERIKWFNINEDTDFNKLAEKIINDFKNS
ncbi:MAG TPA: tRNA (adenosine(37)-N6)-dimethylallyltransferase MiaA [Bacteroidetes bacterium]|nr:tRNA (adenosine(37)-N6)-dimethylallyltransferase MiaA [Bacteroidota bacterium]